MLKAQNTKRRSTPACQRHRTRGNGILYLPPGYYTAEKADLYSDGEGRLAIHFHEDGKFKMITASRGSLIKMMTIPKIHSSRFPLKTSDVRTYWEEGMLIVNTLQFPEPGISP